MIEDEIVVEKVVKIMMVVGFECCCLVCKFFLEYLFWECMVIEVLIVCFCWFVLVCWFMVSFVGGSYVYMGLFRC